MSYCRLLLTPRMTLLIVIGSLIYSVGLNQFIVPVGLYNGGFLGIAQLIRHFMESWFGISFGNTNIAGILYFILNIPLLAVSVKRFGKEFLAKTIYCVCWYSLFLTVVPIADHLLVDEHLTAFFANRRGLAGPWTPAPRPRRWPGPTCRSRWGHSMPTGESPVHSPR